jgi:hypothetical protein
MQLSVVRNLILSGSLDDSPTNLQEKDELTQHPQQKRMGHYSEAALEHY